MKNGGHRDRWITIEAQQQPIVHDAVSFAIKDELYGEDIGAAMTLREGFFRKATGLFWTPNGQIKFKYSQAATNLALLKPEGADLLLQQCLLPLLVK